MNKNILMSETYSARKLEAIRSELVRSLRNRDYTVVTVGSFARGEASSESDLDWFVICDSAQAKKQAEADLSKIRTILERHVKKPPAPAGAFGSVTRIDDMTRNIGGDLDVNAKITCRLLFLLEGEWLLGEALFRKYRKRIIGRYVSSKISDHQFCRFLLNDLIRYYRTICVDFEHKTGEQNKAWGDRNIKLIFSRKLMYFSGVIVAAETWQHRYTRKLEKIMQLLDLTPIRRIEHVCGARAEQSLIAYGEFLRKLGDPEVRRMLRSVSLEGNQPEEFRFLKNDGHHFSWKLAKLLKDTYDQSHPIHNAMVV